MSDIVIRVENLGKKYVLGHQQQERYTTLRDQITAQAKSVGRRLLTTTRIAIKGRVASLLEVGTGFHSELTGRENIYLNGAILGMSKIWR